jgi:pimeloyl-ACP methyl ester carboxylesterase
VSDTALQSGHGPVNGISMYYEVHGRKGGVPLVLLHGAHGRTTDRYAPVAFESSADDVATLLRYLRADKADILGFSNGASVALQVAIRHPQLVRKMVLLDHAATARGRVPAGESGRAAAQDRARQGRARMQGFKDVPDDSVQSVGAPTLIVLDP